MSEVTLRTDVLLQKTMLCQLDHVCFIKVKQQMASNNFVMQRLTSQQCEVSEELELHFCVWYT